MPEIVVHARTPGHEPVARIPVEPGQLDSQATAITLLEAISDALARAEVVERRHRLGGRRRRRAQAALSVRGAGAPRADGR